MGAGDGEEAGGNVENKGGGAQGPVGGWQRARGKGFDRVRECSEQRRHHGLCSDAREGEPHNHPEKKWLHGKNGKNN